MALKITKEEYAKLIEEDVKLINKHLPDNPDRDHINLVLFNSIDMHYPSDGSTSKKAEASGILPLVNGWLDFDSNRDLFDIMATKNCPCRFEDGTICNYDDDHPMEVMTHFKMVY